MYGIVFQRGKKSDGVNTLMMEESLILSVNECSPEFRVYVVVLYRLPVLIEEFSE